MDKIENNLNTISNKVTLLVEFYLLYGREPKAREEYKGVNIGYFLQDIRKGSITLNSEECLILTKVGYRLNWLSKEEKIHNNAMLLVEFLKKYKRPPESTEIYKEVKIGRFYDRIRKDPSQLSLKDKKEIEDLGFKLKVVDVKKEVENKVNLLIEFYKKYKREPKQKEEYKGIKLGIFLMNIRDNRTKIKKSEQTSLKKAGIKITK